MRQYISDIIDKETASSWEKGQNIVINAPTGSGKTTFILGTLYEIAKEENSKILILESRSDAKEKFIADIERECKNDVITVETYQKNDFIVNHDLYSDVFYGYKYICCDEFHYVYDDANFNDTSHITFDTIFNTNEHIKIYLSATCEKIAEDMKEHDENLIEYKVDKDWSHIELLRFFYSDDDIPKIIESIPKEEKCIVFYNSSDRLYDLYKQYGGIFNCSKTNKLGSKVNKEVINDILAKEKFDDRILFTTSVWDNAINIKDESVKHIIIVGFYDVNQIIQCIGRKRIINDNDKVSVHIKALNKKQIAATIKNLDRELVVPSAIIADENICYGQLNVLFGKSWYKNKYITMNENTKLRHEVNITKYNATLSRLRTFKEMKKEDKYHPFIKYFVKIIGYSGKYFIGDVDIVEYLKELYKNKTVLLTNEDKAQLIAAINYRDIEHNRLYKTDTKLNEYLISRNIHFQIKKFETKRGTDGEYKKYKNAWKIIML